MSTSSVVSNGNYTFAELECSMSSLLVFIKKENFCIDTFLENQFKEKDVLQAQVITGTDDKIFFFGLITYINKKAAATAKEHFCSIGIFTQCVSLYKSKDKIDDLEGKPVDIDIPFESNIYTRRSYFRSFPTEIKTKAMGKHLKKQCVDIFEEYQHTEDLNHVMNQLINNSLISENLEKFVTSLLLNGLSDGPKVLEAIGIFFTKIIMKRVISVEAVNDGINKVIIKWTVHILNFPHFFTHIASVIAPLILTCKLYDVHQLKDAFQPICPNVSSVLIIELLKAIVAYSGQYNEDKHYNGIILLYYKWTISKYTSLDSFLPCEQLNKYFKSNQFGVFLLSIALYDQMRDIEPTKMYTLMCEWINHNIKKQIIDDPVFVRALTIAAVFLNIKNDVLYTKFFNYMTGELLTYYIKSKPFETCKIQAREVQCLYGIQIAVAVLRNPPPNLVFKLFNSLHQETIVSSESFKIWKDEKQFNAEFIDDQETKKKALESFIWNDLLIKFASNNSNE